MFNEVKILIEIITFILELYNKGFNNLLIINFNYWQYWYSQNLFT